MIKVFRYQFITVHMGGSNTLMHGQMHLGRHFIVLPEFLKLYGLATREFHMWADQGYLEQIILKVIMRNTLPY